jgi:hypothetical protein
MDQFRDFRKFVAAIDSYGMQSGIVKVIPPQEWSVMLRSHASTTPHPRPIIPPYYRQPV